MMFKFIVALLFVLAQPALAITLIDNHLGDPTQQDGNVGHDGDGDGCGCGGGGDNGSGNFGGSDNSGTCPSHDGPDLEEDGIVDRLDNCPGVSNPDQEDTDGNGIGDACEGAVPTNRDVDTDKDGVADAWDNCP